MVKDNIIVLRLSHRTKRDVRVSTHAALASRALGVDKLYYSGEKDENMELSINKVVNRFGGNFEIEFIKEPFKFVNKNKKEGFKIINLTMYGLRVQDIVKKIRKDKKILIIIGSEKVPIEYYNVADYNVSVSNQPHSEISALAVFLHEYFNGKELDKKFNNAVLKIIPMKKGKLLKEKRV